MNNRANPNNSKTSGKLLTQAHFECNLAYTLVQFKAFAKNSVGKTIGKVYRSCCTSFSFFVSLSRSSFLALTLKILMITRAHTHTPTHSIGYMM